MKIGIITYDAPHLKTEQVVLGMAGRAEHVLAIFALPFLPRPSRPCRFPHRPEMAAGAHPREVARTAEASYTPVARDAEIPSDCDLYLVCGAGILSPECVRGKRILNAHPGVIPAVRGLDAFKWALLEDQPLGNTLHFIDETVDAGEVVAVLRTPVYSHDTYASLARRHYALEIAMMQQFAFFLAHPRNDFPGLAPRDARRRLPLDREVELPAAVNRCIAATPAP